MATKVAVKPTTGKRKRDSARTPLPRKRKATTTTLQIITGSYERVLHGFIVSIPSLSSPSGTTTPEVRITDNFLFNAHASAIRCLALSAASASTPTAPSRRTLATGSTDARVNVYHINAIAPPVPTSPTKPSLLPLPVAGSSANREVGTLSHHESTVTKLHFPSRAKLLSGSADNTIAVTRTHDWFRMSAFRAPIPRAAGRPSGDTASAGEVPAGINDFAVHPSQRLMISVGEGDKSMRLWNMLTGQRQGNLEFGRPLLNAVGASRWRGAEGRRIVWSDDGIEFAVAFERGVAVYGLDLEVRGVAKPSPLSKVCEVRYLTRHGEQGNVLAVSTEDGRVVFYGTDLASLEPTSSTVAPSAVQSSTPSSFRPLAHLGPLPAVGTRGSRIKDFIVLRPSSADSSSTSDGEKIDDGKATNGAKDDEEDNDGDDIQVDVPDVYYIVTATSEGTVKVWSLSVRELDMRKADAKESEKEKEKEASAKEASAKEIGELLGSYETGRRVTCLEGFVMEEEDLGDEQVVSGVSKPTATVANGAASKQVKGGRAVEQEAEVKADAASANADDDGDEFGGFSDAE